MADFIAQARTAGKGVRMSDQWAVDFFHAIDAMDVPTLVKAFADDGTFRFANNEPAVGRQQVEQAIAGFFSMIGGLSHDLTGVWSDSWVGGEVKIVEAEVTYTRKDGTRTQPLPVVSTLRMQGDQIKDYRIFMDIAPVFTP
jgi:ketosteroid isomerase-like protein